MSTMTIRELNANISRAVARAESGETIDVVRNGQIVAHLVPRQARTGHDPAWRAAMDRLLENMREGVAFGRTFSHDERNR